MRKAYFLIVCCGLLGACGGRVAHPVEATTSYDNELSCDHLKAEIAVNKRHIADLRDEKKHSETNNAAYMFLPIFVDVSPTEQKEIEALEKRNEVLNTLASRRCKP